MNARMEFVGYECLMAFPGMGIRRVTNRTYRGMDVYICFYNLP